MYLMCGPKGIGTWEFSHKQFGVSRWGDVFGGGGLKGNIWTLNHIHKTESEHEAKLRQRQKNEKSTPSTKDNGDVLYKKVTLGEWMGNSILDSGRRRTDFPCLWKREGRLKQRKRSHGCVYTFLSCWRASVDIFIELKRKENSSERGELDMLMIFCEILQQHRLGEFRARATLHWSTTDGCCSSGCEADPQTKVQDRTLGLSEWQGAGQQR